MRARWILVPVLLQFFVTAPVMAERPVVLELFTSQGCSSCPPADELLTRLAKDPSLLALSFHIDYWDRLGWKDPYSSPAATERQHGYAEAMGRSQVFTPQLVVDGALSAVGSRENEVSQSIERAKNTLPSDVTVTFTPNMSSDGLLVDISGAVKKTDVWLVYFDRTSSTQVRAGENSGRKMVSTNAVTDIRYLGAPDQDKAEYNIAMPKEGVAVIVQTAHQQRILGAGVLFRPPV